MTFYNKEVIRIQQQLYPEALYRQVVLSKTFIETYFANPIRLNDMAASACISKYHFIRLFKNTYGRTPHQYLTAVRIAEAKSLLRAGWPVVDVCVAVGFDSVTSFTGLYKKITGATPAAFQHKIRNKAKKQF